MAQLARPEPPAPDDNDRAGAALVGLGVGLLIYACAPPELRAQIVAAVRRTLAPRPPAPPARDLAAKYPGAIDV